MADEPPKEGLIPKVGETQEDLSEVNKSLMHQLNTMVPGVDKESSGRFVYLDQSESTPLFEFSILRKFRNGVQSVDIHPHTVSSKEKTQRSFATSRGVFPEAFIDKNGKTWSTHVKYQLDDTGKGQKWVKVYEVIGGDSDLPVSDIDIPNGEDLDFPDALVDGDYQQIRSYITLFNTGQLKVS